MMQALVLDPPVRGQWAIFNPPGHPRLAFDFLAVNENKSPYDGATLFSHVFSNISVSSTRAWDKPVFAVADGCVIAASDGAPDREQICMMRDLLRLLLWGPKVAPPFCALGGNHVILHCGDCYPLYAHLRSGSVLVKPGDVVRKGDPLGRVGNSGSSLQPHLHFQVMKTADPFPLFQNLMPFVLSVARKRLSGRWQSLQRLALKNRDHLFL